MSESGHQSSENRYAGWGPRATIYAASVASICRAIQTHNGAYDPTGVIWLGIGFLLAWIGLLAPVERLFWRRETRLIFVGIGLGLAAWMLEQLWFDSPMGDAGVPAIYYFVGPPILTLAAALAIGAPGRFRMLALSILLAVHFCTGLWLLDHSRKPYIDVYVVGQEACKAFSRGANPYSINIPDIYAAHPDWQKNFYPPDYLASGPVKLSYSYMPLSFGVAWAGYLASGDSRVGNLLAITATAALLGWGARGRGAVLAACLLLLSPRLFYLLYNGWTEPVVLVCLAAAVAAACRTWKSLPWIFGLLLASKQYMVLAAPAALLMLERPWTFKAVAAFYLKAGVAAAVVTLPLALWAIRSFLHTTVALPVNSPFRTDSLNFAAAWARAGHLPPAGWMGFLAAALAMMVALWRAPRTAAGFAGTIAVVYFCFFAFGKQAFGNYYFVLIGAACCAIMAGEFEMPSRELNE